MYFNLKVPTLEHTNAISFPLYDDITIDLPSVAQSASVGGQLRPETATEINTWNQSRSTDNYERQSSCPVYRHPVCTDRELRNCQGQKNKNPKQPLVKACWARYLVSWFQIQLHKFHLNKHNIIYTERRALTGSTNKLRWCVVSVVFIVRQLLVTSNTYIIVTRYRNMLY